MLEFGGRSSELRRSEEMTACSVRAFGYSLALSESSTSATHFASFSLTATINTKDGILTLLETATPDH